MDFGRGLCARLIRARARSHCKGRTVRVVFAQGRSDRLEVRTCKRPWTGSSASSPAAGVSSSVVWLALVVVSVPFAGRQTENLTGGGFETRARARRWSPTRWRATSRPAVRDARGRLRQPRAATRPALAAAVDRVAARGLQGRRGRALRPRGARTPRAPPPTPIVIMPLVVSGDRDEAVDAAAADAREPRHRRARARRCRCTSSARARCGRACRSSPRRTSSRPSSSACRSC